MWKENLPHSATLLKLFASFIIPTLINNQSDMKAWTEDNKDILSDVGIMFDNITAFLSYILQGLVVVIYTYYQVSRLHSSSNLVRA